MRSKEGEGVNICLVKYTVGYVYNNVLIHQSTKRYKNTNVKRINPPTRKQTQ